MLWAIALPNAGVIRIDAEKWRSGTKQNNEHSLNIKSKVIHNHDTFSTHFR